MAIIHYFSKPSLLSILVLALCTPIVLDLLLISMA
jgi:hypothetical protein